MILKKKHLYIVGACLTFPWFLYGFFLVFHPVVLGLLHNVTIVNHSGKAISITLIEEKRNGTKAVVGHFLSRWIAIPAVSNTEIPIKDGQSKTFTYLWYDTDFKEIAVSSHGTAVKTLSLDKDGKSFASVRKGPIIIPPLETLPDSEADYTQISALTSFPRKTYLVICLSLLFLIFACLLLVRVRRNPTLSSKTRSIVKC